MKSLVHPIDRRTHQRDCDNANDNAERREDGAHLVGADGIPGDAQSFLQLDEEVHVLLTGSSLAMSPSRMRIIRRACLATSSSCVTTKIVFPLRDNASSKAIISSPVFESRLPVGSSAKM